jgi:stage II sporulation protein AB (anti-sigma F factor)
MKPLKAFNGGVNMFENTMKVEFLSKSQNESFARVAVAAFISQLDPTIEELADVKTAVSEAVTNAIIHGYGNTIGYITIEVKILGNELEILIRDKGVGIKDIDKAMEPLFTSRPDLERSGMGFTVMETFMDKLKVLSNEKDGTTILMKKKFRSLEE